MSYFQELNSFLRRMYPPFVTALNPVCLRGVVPVFMFHTVADDRFGEQLGFLAENGYHSLTADELLNFLKGSKKVPDGSVVLTFDDGEKSLYTAAFPLLKKFGFRAISFITPSFIKQGKSSGHPGKQWLGWDEIEEMHKSGVIDFQSHTLNHERMFAGKDVIGFYHPGFFADGLGLDVPTVLSGGNYTKLNQTGAPVYRMGSRMGKELRYFDDESLRKDCVEYVKNHGGNSFFEKKMWEKKLGNYFESMRKEKENTGYFESLSERSESILKSLVKSKEILEEKLNKEVNHLAYPWGYGSKLAVSLSMEADYKANFWGPLHGIRINTAGSDSYYIPRLKDDYLFRLPGKGRKSLRKIFEHKFTRRMQSKDIY